VLSVESKRGMRCGGWVLSVLTVRRYGGQYWGIERSCGSEGFDGFLIRGYVIEPEPDPHFCFFNLSFGNGCGVLVSICTVSCAVIEVSIGVLSEEGKFFWDLGSF
jgi:hypothetical protein